MTRHTLLEYGNVRFLGSTTVVVNHGTTASCPKLFTNVSRQQYALSSPHSPQVSMVTFIKRRLGLGPKLKKGLFKTPSDRNTENTNVNHITNTMLVARLSSNKKATHRIGQPRVRNRNTSAMLCILNRVFDDKRIAITCLMIWLVIVLLVFNSIGLFHSDFIRIGPSETTKIMTLTIRTWHEWTMVAIASFTSTCFNDFFSDSLSPFFLNTVQDQKTKYLPYSKLTCYVILQLWSIYCALMSIFSVGLLLSQIDFLLIRLAADLMVNTFTTFKFLQGKEVNRRMYYKEAHHIPEEDDETKTMMANMDKHGRSSIDVFSSDEEATQERTNRH